MTSLYHGAVFGATAAKNRCYLAPTILSCTANDDALNNCGGSTGGWQKHGSITISGTLQSGQEYLWQHQENRSGSWVETGRTTSTTGPTHYSPQIGANGAGASTTRYWQCRCYVVPVGAAAADACSGPVTSSEISRTANACLS